MATNSTASTYISQINGYFPTPGQNNTSQGFRDNFSNIKQALNYTDTDVQQLKLNSVALDSTNNFGYNIIQNAVLQSSTELIYDNTANTVSGDIDVDFSLGNYQKYNLNEGSHLVRVINWPFGNFKSSLILYVTASSINDTYITFPNNYRNLGPLTLPYKIGPSIDKGGPWLFEITYDNSIYTVKQISEYSTSTGASNTTGFNVGDNVYSTGTNHETTVAYGNQFGNFALVPNTITATATGNGSYSPSSLILNTTTGISVGAKFFVNGNTNIFTITNVISTANVVVVNPFVTISSPQTIKFINPEFVDQPTVLTLSTVSPETGELSSINEVHGTVYAHNGIVWVTTSTYILDNTNKIQISGDNTPTARSLGSSTATTQAYNDTSKYVATDEFVWNAITSSTTRVAYSNTSTYSNTATYASTITNVNSNGYGWRTISYSQPTGNRPNGDSYQDGDIWYQI